MRNVRTKFRSMYRLQELISSAYIDLLVLYILFSYVSHVIIIDVVKNGT